MDQPEETAPNSLLLSMIGKEVLIGHIFPFVGLGKYRNVSTTCRVFQECYQAFGEQEKKADIRYTSPSLIVSNRSCVDMYLSDLNGQVPSTVDRLKLMTLSGRDLSLEPANWVDILLLAAIHGNTDVMDYAASNIPTDFRVWRETVVCEAAAFGGHVQSLEKARQLGFPWHARVCAAAAAGGHLAVLQYARSHGCRWDWRTCAKAAEHGHVDILQYAHPRGCPWRTESSSLAASNGHLEVLKWAHAKGFSLDRRVCKSAANKGHLEVLKWARSKGCPWDARTCERAARNGHLDVLKLAHSEGFPLDERTCK